MNKMSPIRDKFWPLLVRFAKALNTFQGFILGCIVCGVVGLVKIAQGGYDTTQKFRGRMPPMWGPNMAHEYSFRHYYRDVQDWMMVTDCPYAQQGWAILTQLRGTAKKMIKKMTPAELITGGYGHDGKFRSPVPLILDCLRRRFGHLDEETRLIPLIKQFVCSCSSRCFQVTSSPTDSSHVSILSELKSIVNGLCKFM